MSGPRQAPSFTGLPLAILLLVASMPAHALDGKALQNLCQDKEDRMSEALCLGYVTGVTEAVTRVLQSSGVCAPQGLTPANLKDAVAKYMQAHPQELEKPAANMVWSALVEAWPCPGMKRAPAKPPGG